jgi:2-dehydro-3-deoxygluconokinase
MINVSSFGEILVRLMPLNKSVFISMPQYLEFSFGGAELNFLVNVANFGGRSFLISALPNNPLGNAAYRMLDKFNIDKRYVRMSNKGRMGLYFVEEGIANRASNVLYDRKGSSFNFYKFENYPFHKAFLKSSFYHITGITPGLSEDLLYTTLRSVRLAKEMKLEVSCDLNYRSKLWDYKINGEPVNKESAMSDIAVYCDYIFGNEIDIIKFYNINVNKKVFKNFEDILIYYQNILLSFSKRFPHVKIVALSIRKSKSASSNYIGGVLYIRQSNQFYFSPNINNRFKPYLIEPINDRIGAGDAFSSGFLIGLKKYQNPQYALDFAVASSVLKHSYRGDVSYATLSDVECLLNGDKFGRIKR